MRLSKTLLYAMPKRTLTAAVGAFSRRPASRHVIPLYAKFYHINTNESEQDVSEYTSLASFFSRRLHQGARPVSHQGIVSPVDGTVQGHGEIRQQELLQAKGSHYTVEALLGDKKDAEKFIGGQYVTLYLSPRDYHRIHMPIAGVLKRWRYIPGKLYPVNALGVRHIHGLFTKNERLVTFADACQGQFAVVKIGATIVGSIRTPYGPSYKGAFVRTRRTYSEGTVASSLSAGAELGYFEFGSTVILLFSKDMGVELNVSTNQFVLMGSKIGNCEKDYSGFRE
ncbi:archaetidylserine decarboxylase [Alicyclobacillus sp. SO9]|uniref:archaetidylserine decarboxylase n=1 Tax=Alicyclobacillus sp. SO9 TaxID=2665646 RepID=UPI0018E7EF19|nr:archaetidylserine decarboxylase [Alicyclobacillus sp. SO9]QQE80749.1 phosphatidylserine decarboxylase [Alicyclobacillus sp. SO9]